jgi:Tol biopolymer transport system component
MKNFLKLSPFFISFLLLSFFLLLSCTQASKVESPKKSILTYEEQRAALPPPVLLPGAEPLTVEGENFSPILSLNGEQFLFVSRKRIQHKHEQIYLYDLNTRKEQRLTWNDGITTDPIFSSTQKDFFYSSNTDELKEKPFLLRKILLKTSDPEETQNSEIYLSSLDGEDIHRLTEHPGFDGFLQKTKKNMIFLSLIEKKFQIQSAQLKTNTLIQLKTLYKSETPLTDLSASVTQNLVAWIQVDSKNTTSQLMVAPLIKFNPQFINLPEGYYQNPIWLNQKNKILVSAKLKEKADFDIYVVDISKLCLCPVIDYPGDDITPTVNPMNTFVIFSHRSEAGQHLFKKNLDLNSIDCH